MRRYLALLVPMLLALSAQANDPPSKPIKSASAKEEASASAASGSASASASTKEERKPGAKESKESAKEAAVRAKEALAADELAARIAERLSVIRKEKDEAAARSAPKPVPRPAYAPPVRRPEVVKSKSDHGGGNGAAAGTLAVHGQVHWSYQGEGGPLNWGKLNPANAKCDIGERQSPIDIRDGIKVDLDPIAFDYKPSRFSVVDNGHTIQVNMGAGNYINVLGHNYELAQFHFHKPSEERVNGKSFEMVAHLVHKDADGKLAVVAVLIERGKAHSLVQHVWNNLPLEKNEPVQALTTMDMNDILPVKRDYYTYMGSLTTPPCSEGVLWLVMKEPIEISPDQLTIFSRLYPMNARPIQKNSGRLIKESN
ncbi:carbonic anhydrase family protein [Undibacterium sp. TS12]|uniref:carbonic anhydrase n=1 Tax=Undibacterium sp. TS12 TaxID=2908202 RepID=UPI001F4C9592|nr:carbonic anhydrase family protein [Undibacterium sp. TS12]MCH8621881.1 carbonic anhydrase family protein [Undibacterium sp. TS12]